MIVIQNQNFVVQFLFKIKYSCTRIIINIIEKLSSFKNVLVINTYHFIYRPYFFSLLLLVLFVFPILHTLGILLDNIQIRKTSY